MWISVAIPTKTNEPVKIGTSKKPHPGSDKKITTGSAPAGGWVKRNAAITVMAIPTANAMAHHSPGKTIRSISAKALATT